MSILSTVPAFILNNMYALNDLLREGVEDYLAASQKELYTTWRRWAYTASYDRDSSRPEHVFDERWKMFCTQDTAMGHSLLAHALRFLGNDYLQPNDSQLRIKTYEQFEHWQNLHARMTLLPVIEWKARDAAAHDEDSEADDTPLILYPYNKRLEDYIQRQGLNEMHLHINLCISAEEMWLVCLYHPIEYEDTLNRAHGLSAAMLRQLNPQLTIREHIQRQRLAKSIRHLVLDLLVSGQEPKYKLDTFIQHYHNPLSVNGAELPHPQYTDIPEELSALVKQERFIWRQFSQRDDSDTPYYTLLSTALHVYLLIMNEFVCLTRFRDNQIGLQEFCKTASYPRNLDDATLYSQAFRTCTRHMGAHKHNKIEVRFNPASNIAGKCLKIINGAYRAVGHPLNAADNTALLPFIKTTPLPFHLILTGHLIKRVPKQLEQSGQSQQCKEARNRYLKEVGALLTWHKQGKHHLLPIGLDVAGSEVVLPVDVFVAAFKAYSSYNSNSRTFHCGEDFRHLITGMRAVYEAIHLLNFTPGNRVGHAVALGIHPDIWLDSMPGKVVMTRREWMLDLIFCRAMFLRYGLPESDILFRIEEELSGCAAYVFAQDVNLHTLMSLYEARALIPEMVAEYLWQRHRTKEMTKPTENSLAFDLAERELRILDDFELRHGLLPLQLFYRWDTDSFVQEKLDGRIEIATDFLSSRYLLQLQQHMQRFVKERGIVIESLPISNYRISPYKRLKYLHTLRWMQVEGCKVAGDTEMDICLGSDDPGIFASDIKAEYYHLFCMMKEYGLSDEEAVSKLAKANETGRIYSFSPIRTSNVRAT